MRILIVQTSFLGDVVLSTPVFAAIRKHFPDAHVTVMVRPESAAILAGHPAIDEVLVDDKHGATHGWGTWRTIRQLREHRFDLVVSLHKSFRTAWLLAAARIPRRIGFRESTGWFLFHRTTRRDKSKHEVERNLAILRCLDLEPRDHVAPPYVVCTTATRADFRAMLSARGVEPGRVLIGIAPGSAWATKRWTLEGYAALLRDVQAKLDAVPLLLGAKADMEYARAVQRAAGDIGINLVGQTTLPELVAAIDQCAVLVTNDSAPLHIAVARDTPVVAIFGPTTPSMGFGPFTQRATVVEKDLSCRPCSRHGGATCPIATHACMKDIGADEVLAALQRHLDADARRASAQ